MFLLIILIIIVIVIIYYYGPSFKTDIPLPDLDKSQELKKGFENIKEYTDARLNKINKDIETRLHDIEWNITNELVQLKELTSSLNKSTDKHTQFIYGKINSNETNMKMNRSSIKNISDLIQINQINKPI